LNIAHVLSLATAIIYATRHADPVAAGDAAQRIVRRFCGPLCDHEPDTVRYLLHEQMETVLPTDDCPRCGWPISLHKEALSKGETA
jgi:hypothetical protein